MSSVHQVFLAVIRRFLKANFKKSIVLRYDNMNSRHSVAAVFSFRRKGTGGKFKFATDLPDIVLICALQQNRQKKHTNLQTFTICRVNKMWYNTSRRGQLQGRFPLCRYCVPRCGLQFGRICPTKYNCTARISSVRCSFLMYSMA